LFSLIKKNFAPRILSATRMSDIKPTSMNLTGFEPGISLCFLDHVTTLIWT